MNIIADGGISTKNTLINTKGAITLSLKSKIIKGICLNLAYTSDDVLVIIDRTNLLFTTNGKGYIKNNTYDDLLHYNTGTKVLNTKVLTLKEVLDIYNNSEKELILNLEYQEEKTDKYINSIISMISKYNINIYLKSSNKIILDKLKSSNTRAKIGIVIDDNNYNEINNNYDFYVINTYSITKEMIIDKYKNDKIVMTELINDNTGLVGAYYTYGEYIIDNIYIITYNSYNIYKDINNLKNLI